MGPWFCDRLRFAFALRGIYMTAEEVVSVG